VEEWTYDDAARLVEARVVYLRRDVEPYYAVDITNTYDGDRIVSVHDREPEDLVDLTYEYELDSGRVVSYVESAAGETRDSRVYSYDSEGRLVGSRENFSDEANVWRLERRLDGEPSRLYQNDELACEYAWRHIWLGTTCYTDGVVSQVYTADAAQRLGSLRFDGSDPVEYTYDEAGRLTVIRHTNAVFEYRYAPDGKLLESIGPDYEVLREYDESGQIREVRWSGESGVSTTTFTYERRSPDEVVQTEVSSYRTVVRTYARLSHAPTGEPVLPSYWTILRTDQPTVYTAPLDFSDVP
jgi:YD repeat-containing protein